MIRDSLQPTEIFVWGASCLHIN